MRRTCMLFLAGLVATSCADAGPSAVSLSGYVTDRATGAPVAGARVFVAGTAATTESAADGSWSLAAPIGATAVSVERDGYLAMRRAADGDAPVTLRLFPAVTDEETEGRLLARAVAMDIGDLSGDLRPEAR